MAVAEGATLPLAAGIANVASAEVTLIDATLDAAFFPTFPPYLVDDNDYDGDAFDVRLADRWNVALIASHRRNRIRRRAQDGRPLRHYRRRWKKDVQLCHV